MKVISEIAEKVNQAHDYHAAASILTGHNI